MTDLVPISDRSDKPIQYPGFDVLERLVTLRQAGHEFQVQWQDSLAKANLWVWPSEYIASVEKDLLRAKNRWVFNWRDFRPASWTKMTPLWYGGAIASASGLIHLGDGWYSLLRVIGLFVGLFTAFGVLIDFLGLFLTKSFVVLTLRVGDLNVTFFLFLTTSLLLFIKLPVFFLLLLSEFFNNLSSSSSSSGIVLFSSSSIFNVLLLSLQFLHM